MKLKILLLSLFLGLLLTACGNKQKDYEEEIKNIPNETVADMFTKKIARTLPAKYKQGTLKLDMQKAYSKGSDMYFTGVISNFEQVQKEEHLLIKSICSDTAFRAMFNKGIEVHYVISKNFVDEDHINYDITKQTCKDAGFDTELLLE